MPGIIICYIYCYYNFAHHYLFQLVLFIRTLVHIQDSINTIINVSYAVDVYVTQVDTYIHAYIHTYLNEGIEKDRNKNMDHSNNDMKIADILKIVLFIY